jgi:hypothetical protein
MCTRAAGSSPAVPWFADVSLWLHDDLLPRPRSTSEGRRSRATRDRADCRCAHPDHLAFSRCASVLKIHTDMSVYGPLLRRRVACQRKFAPTTACGGGARVGHRGRASRRRHSPPSAAAVSSSGGPAAASSSGARGRAGRRAVPGPHIRPALHAGPDCDAGAGAEGAVEGRGSAVDGRRPGLSRRGGRRSRRPSPAGCGP